MMLKRGSVPLHYQLREILRNRIVRGEFEPGDQFPTEKELQAEFGVSQTTVRRALSELTREGLLERTPGKGTFVRRTESELDLGPITSFSQEMARRRLNPGNEVVRAEIVDPPPHVIEALQLAPPDPGVFCLERVRLVGDLPLMLETAYIPVKRFPGIADVNWNDELSLLQVLLKTYHVQLTEVQEIVEPTLITERHASLLHVEPFSPALHLSSVLLTHNGACVQYSDAIIPRQCARYQVRVAGRQTAEEPTTSAGRSLVVILPGDASR
jgi:GntR family transcriptional regulator